MTVPSATSRTNEAAGWRGPNQFTGPGPVAERFWSKVDRSGECWLWMAPTTRGYGRFFVDGHYVNAHRFAYEALVGPVPDGLQLDHLCRNRGCVNPMHLEAVEQAENIRRGMRAMQTHCKRGHEFTPENTYRPKADPQHRYCRACHRIRDAERRAILDEIGGAR